MANKSYEQTRREELQTTLENLLGSSNVYFQPGPNVKMSYDAIVYAKDDIRNVYADNTVYGQNTRYSVTLISRDPDSDIIYALSKLPKCTYERHFASDNLNHDVFNLFW